MNPHTAPTVGVKPPEAPCISLIKMGYRASVAKKLPACTRNPRQQLIGLCHACDLVIGHGLAPPCCQRDTPWRSNLTLRRSFLPLFLPLPPLWRKAYQ